MSVILKDIDQNKRSKNDYSNSQSNMESLEYYDTLARKTISMFAGSSAAKMLKDDDAVSHVSEHIMWGHLRWKEDGGRTLKSYLNQCGIWAIKIWKTKIYKSSEGQKIHSLNHGLSSSDSDSCELYQITMDKKCEEPFNELFNNTRQDALSIIKDESLTNLQKKCLYQRYIEGKKLRQIAESMTVSKQAVDQNIKKAIQKLRKKHDISE